MKIVTLYSGYTKIANFNIDVYIEEVSAYPSSRLLEGSRDHGYYVEYIGEGYLSNPQLKVRAVYLFEEDEYETIMVSCDGDEGSLDWDSALKRFELEEDLSPSELFEILL